MRLNIASSNTFCWRVSRLHPGTLNEGKFWSPMSPELICEVQMVVQECIDVQMNPVYNCDNTVGYQGGRIVGLGRDKLPGSNGLSDHC